MIADDLAEPTPETIEALAGAVGEALANAGKHSGAERVVVYAEPEDDGVFVSIKDNGVHDCDTGIHLSGASDNYVKGNRCARIRTTSNPPPSMTGRDFPLSFKPGLVSRMTMRA